MQPLSIGYSDDSKNNIFNNGDNNKHVLNSFMCKALFTHNTFYKSAHYCLALCEW